MKFQITGLTKGKFYEFRVCAANIAGTGPFSEASAPIEAKRAPCAPRIDLNMLVRDILALAGDPVKIVVPYVASPAPTIVWTRVRKAIYTPTSLE